MPKTMMNGRVGNFALVISIRIPKRTRFDVVIVSMVGKKVPLGVRQVYDEREIDEQVHGRGRRESYFVIKLFWNV